MKKYRISPLMLMLMAAFIIIDGTWFALFAVMCALWHEIWHMIILHILGGNTQSVSFSQYGIGLKTNVLSYRQEAAVALAGPAASLALTVVFAVIARYFVFTEITVFIAFSNFALFLVNILPVYPLDGGRALHCFLCMHLNIPNAIRLTRIISVIFLLPITVFSAIILIRTGYNLSLMIICIYLAILLIGVKDI